MEPSKSSQTFFDDFLKSMEAPNVEKPEVFPDIEVNEMIAKMEADMELESETASFENVTAKTWKTLESPTDTVENELKVSCSPSTDDPKNEDSEDEEFDKKFEEQQRKHKEEWEQKRRERAEKQKKVDEELKELRGKGTQKSSNILETSEAGISEGSGLGRNLEPSQSESSKVQENFVNGNSESHEDVNRSTSSPDENIFQIREEHLIDWIKSCGQSLMQLHDHCREFIDDVERDQKGFRRPDVIDQKALQQSTSRFISFIMDAYSIFQSDFEDLEDIESTYPDALFVRVLMKCIADVAEKLLEVYSMTDNMGFERSEYLKLQSELSKLTPNLVYSSSQLRSICKTANSCDYQNIVFPNIKPSLKIQEYD